MKEEILSIAKSIENELITIRRHIHANPELSEQEFNTAEFVSKTLTKWGIQHKTNVGGTGIVAEIKAENAISTVVLRADMDALPIQELNDIEYSSKVSGVMHACGHDVHITCLLGAVFILNKLKNNLKKNIKFIFQPSEEKFPGGATAMIKAGVLENPVPEAIYGLHVMPELEVGKVGFVSGKAMASTDEIYLTVKGKTGHGAIPNMSIDPIVIASHIIVALQQVVSRRANPLIPTVLSFGRFIAEGRTNIIPQEVKIDGTIRTFDEDWRKQAHQIITDIAVNTAKGMGGECEVFIDKGYPYLVNDKNLTENSKEKAIELFGKDNVVDILPRMTAEDFAFYSHLVPACFFRLGVKNPEWKEIRNLHTPTFDADENAIIKGAAMMAFLALK